MSKISRKDFLQKAGALLALPGIAGAVPFKATKPLLSFSTLGCPDWTLTQIVEFASAHHYNGVEIRGIQQDMDLSKCKHFESPAAIAETKKIFRDHHLSIVNLGASCELHKADSPEGRQNLDEAKRFIDIAAAVGCPYVRVFPNRFLTDRPHDDTIAIIAKALSELGNHAKGTGVKVLMETHGDLTLSDDVLKVMKAVSSDDTGLVWDVSNMWAAHKESPVDVYKKLSPYIFHLHVKDVKITGDTETPVLLGRGDVPILEAVDVVTKNKYPGYLSFEWEKRWHPEIETPEIAIADYMKKMTEHFSKR